MRRWLRFLVAALVVLAVLVALNAVVTDHQTKDAAVTIHGGRILHLPGGDLQVLDSGPVAYLSVQRDGKPPAPAEPPGPIVLLHCYTCAIDWWSKLTPLLERAGHRVIAIDLLGHGGSDKPRSGYSIPDQGALVAQALGRLKVDHATVVGHSLGGAVAVALAEQSPDQVDAITILDTKPDTSYGSLDLLAQASLTPVIGEALWRVKVDASIRAGLEQAFASDYDVPDSFVDDVKRLTYSSYDGSHSGFDSYVGESPLDRRAARLGLPLLVAFGVEDQIVDARDALSAYAGVPDAQTALIQGSGHSPNVEKPAQTANMILRFARESATPRAAKPKKPRATAPRQIIARCAQAIIGSGQPDWRKRSIASGTFGLFGPGRDLSKAAKEGTAFVSKIPAFLESHKPVILRVPGAERGQVGLIYGPIRFVRAVDQAAGQVTFQPCPDKPRTVWPGGLALAGRGPVTLELIAGDSVKKLRIG